MMNFRFNISSPNKVQQSSFCKQNKTKNFNNNNSNKPSTQDPYNVGLHYENYILISFSSGLTRDTAKLYSLIPT